MACLCEMDRLPESNAAMIQQEFLQVGAKKLCKIQPEARRYQEPYCRL